MKPVAPRRPRRPAQAPGAADGTPRPCPWPSLRSVSQGCGFYKLKARPSLSERTVTCFTAVHATVHEHRRCQTYRVPGVRVCSVEVTVGVGAGDLVLNEAIQTNSSR